MPSTLGWPWCKRSCFCRQYELESPQNSGNVTYVMIALRVGDAEKLRWLPSWPYIEIDVQRTAASGTSRTASHSGPITIAVRNAASARPRQTSSMHVRSSRCSNTPAERSAARKLLRSGLWMAFGLLIVRTFARSRPNGQGHNVRIGS
jgi:hypothetical protein